MDVMVKPVQDRNEWVLTDLLGRAMGVIRTTEERTFLVEPEGNAKMTMSGMRPGPFHSLDEALAAIETHTRGVCRRVAEAPQEDPTGSVKPTDTSTDMSRNASSEPK